MSLAWMLLLVFAGWSGETPTLGVTNETVPEEGVIFGGQPTADQLRALSKVGGEVINLRMPEEDAGFAEPALAVELGLEYRSLPVNGEALSDPATFERFFDLLESAKRPVLVHCASGNRVGALYYAFLVERRGVERSQALTQARQYGLRSEALQQAVERHLDREKP